MAYLLTLGRAPTAKETERALSYLRDYEAEVGRDGHAHRSLDKLCQALLASAEFRYVR